MIDTHAHLSSRFAQDVDLSLLKYIILSASNQQDSVDNLALAKTNPKLLPSVGIHPSEVWADIDAQINFLDYLLSQNPNIVAVGECGLEFVENINKKQQEILFRAQICLAQKYHKPLIVHSREASDETIDILSQYQDLTGVIHCYTGGKKRIPKVLNLPGKWYFGLDGNLTYESGLEEVAKNIPHDRLVLETDTPYLAPVPHRNQTNQPSYIKYTYEKLAQIWDLPFAATESQIDLNASKLFDLLS